MRILKIFLIFIIIFPYFILNLKSSDLFKLPEITSTTFLTQDLSTPLPQIEIITSEDIKSLGINNIPDLLKLTNGINSYELNRSTAEVSLRGFPTLLKIVPIILIDGMEISENVYERTYFYNLPLDILDIDRIEIIKSTTYTENGYNNISGIINIVTKSSETLDNNYIYQEVGSNFYKKTSFSVNNYTNGFYWKINGYFNRVDQSDVNFKNLNSKYIGFTANRYIKNSKLTIKSSFMEEDMNFKEGSVVGVPQLHKALFVTLNNRMDNVKYFNLLLDYKMKNFDMSLYTQNYYGNFYYLTNNGYKKYYTNNNFSKFELKKKFNLLNDRDEIISGFTLKYRYSYINGSGSMKRDSGEFFIQNKFRFNKNLSFLVYFNNNRTKNLGNKINYKFNLIYNNTDKDFYVNLGYSRSFRQPFMVFQYVNYKFVADRENVPWLKKVNLNKIDIIYRKNKNISSHQIKSSELSLMKRFYKKFTFNVTGFYNLIYDIPVFFANVNLFPFFHSVISTFNKEDMAIYGYDSKVEYNNRNWRFFVNYFYQKIHDKTHHSRKNYLIPRYKISSGFIFNLNNFRGSLTSIYYPSIKFHYGDIDSYLLVNGSISKAFFKDKLTASLYISNIFNNRHREAKFGDKLERNIILRLKYEF